MECIGRHSSILEIRNADVRGQIYIEAGAVTHATVGPLTGRTGFPQTGVLARRGISCETVQSAAATHDQRSLGIFADGRRPRFGRRNWHAPKICRVAAPPAAAPAKPAGEHEVLGEDIVVVATYDGQWNSEDAGKK